METMDETADSSAGVALRQSRPARTAIHEDKACRDYILSTVNRPAPLRIGASVLASPGSGLFAEDIIEEGRLVYSSKPMIACVDGRSDTICHYCLGDSSRLIFGKSSSKTTLPTRCTGCMMARFCSKKCHTKAWKAFHKDECKILEDARGIEIAHQVLYRILFWLKQKKLSTDTVRALELLEHHFHEYSESEAGDDLFEYTSAIRNTANPDVALHVVLHLLPAIQTNAIRMRHADKSTTFGVALDLLSCVINHSCEPNIFLIVENGNIIARSLRPIKRGEEITMCYVDFTASLRARQLCLNNQYFFRCYCQRCTSEKKEEKAMVTKEINTLEALHEVQDMMVQVVNNAVIASKNPGAYKEFEDVSSIETQLLGVVRRAFPIEAWPEHLEPMPTVRSSLAWLYLNKDNPMPALKNALKATLMSRYRTGPEWVNNLGTLTQCLAALASLAPDASAFQVAHFPRLGEIQRLVYGYGMIVCKEASHVFGSTGYTTFLCEWFAVVVKRADPRPDTKEFQPFFMDAQKKLLAWAGIGSEFGIVPMSF